MASRSESWTETRRVTAAEKRDEHVTARDGRDRAICAGSPQLAAIRPALQSLGREGVPVCHCQTSQATSHTAPLQISSRPPLPLLSPALSPSLALSPSQISRLCDTPSTLIAPGEQAFLSLSLLSFLGIPATCYPWSTHDAVVQLRIGTTLAWPTPLAERHHQRRRGVSILSPLCCTAHTIWPLTVGPRRPCLSPTLSATRVYP